jgi:hypothetical protein
VHGILVYQRIGNDIAIDGQNPHWRLDVAGKRTGQWALRLSQPVESQLSPGLVGRWNDPSGGRDRAVRLDRWTPLAAEPVAYAPISAGESLGREQASGLIAWRLAPVGHTGLRFAQLVRLGDPRVQARVNQRLARSVDELLPCDPEFDAAVTYAGHEVFSVWGAGGYNCAGAAHPEEVYLSVTFDLQDGHEVKFHELFADYPRDQDRIIEALFGEQIERARTASEDECESAYALDRLRETGLAYAFSRDGLIVEPMLPHVIAACIEQVVVPYAKLKPFAHPGSPLARIAS